VELEVRFVLLNFLQVIVYIA